MFFGLNRRLVIPGLHPAGNQCGAGGPASYPPTPPAATLRLTRRILDRIARAGPLDFAAFMEAALYDAADGYYADPGRAIGRHGDFFTSVSVGPAFGAILARWLLDRWRALGAPRHWRVAEPGAHDGQLAADLTTALAALDPAATAGLVYTVPEPLAARRETLARRLATLPVAGLEILGPAAPLPPPLPGATPLRKPERRA